MLSDQNLITVLIADDHPTTRAGIRAILQDALDIKVIGEAESGQDVKKQVAVLYPKILLLDLVMPESSPAEIEKWVRTSFPETITLVLTAHDRDAYLTSMMDAGAAGFISKTEKAEQLIQSIRRAARGEILFNSDQLSRIQHWRADAGNKWEKLTDREREVLHFLSEGLDNKAIASKLTVSSKTIAFHITNILDKLGVSSRHEATAWLKKYFPINLE